MASHLSEQQFLDELRTSLITATARGAQPARFAVAYSGGLDSTVLLAAMTRLALGSPLRALHVDHGIHADSETWEQHCRSVAAGLGVPYRSIRVAVDQKSGRGLEAAAREARYAALAQLLETGETLLTAHHADDQLETVLLRLLRGAGVRGLRGILPETRLGSGRVLRPMLGISRANLRLRAEEWALHWLEDPSNQDVRHDRNYLRSGVLPAIRTRWSAAARSAGRLTAAMADAEEILGSTAEHDLSLARAGSDCFRQEALRSLSEARQRNALRHAIRTAGLSMPSAEQLEEIRRGLGVTRSDASTLVRWPGGEVRFYRGRLYLLQASTPGPEPSSTPGKFAAEPNSAGGSAVHSRSAADGLRARFAVEQPWSGPQGRLELVRVERGDASDSGVRDEECVPGKWAREGFEVRFRSGGERFRPAGDAHSRSLKHWFQDQAIVPWMRGRIPLLYREERLVAIADLAVDQVALDEKTRVEDPHADLWRVRWSGHPSIR